MPFDGEDPTNEGTGDPSKGEPSTGSTNTNKPAPQRRPRYGYTNLAREDPNRDKRYEGKEGLKIRVNADLALDLDIKLKGEIYGDLVIGLITSED